MQLIQIVPRLAPFDGVSDYALLLGRRLREEHALPCSFIAAARGGAAEPAEAATHWMPSRTAESLAAALAAAGAGKGCEVLLHYVGYGYAARGAPLWLVRAISEARHALGFRLGILFHELYATGRPWHSSFWLSGIQRLVARRLAATCDWALATREAARRWLAERGAWSGKSLGVLPMCSTVGEPSTVPPAGAREAVLVVWGGRNLKNEVYGERWPLLRAACRSLGIARIVDLGAPADRCPTDGPAIEQRGLLSATDLSRELLAARFGLVRYPASFLAKSTIYAAYAAHGLVTLLDDEALTVSLDGIEPGRHFLPLAAAARGAPADVLEPAAQAHRWYGSHTSAQHAQSVAALLNGARPWA